MIRRLGLDSFTRTTSRRVLFSSILLAWCAAGCGDGDVIGDGGLGTRGATSITARCGDGTVGGGEQCDDGNTSSGDGCSSTCAREASPAPGMNDAGSAGGATPGGATPDGGAGGAGGTAGDAAANGGADAEMSAGDAASGDGADAGSSGEDASEPAIAEPLCPAEPPGPCEACNCTMCRTQIDACSTLVGNATEGPAQGMSKAALCEALVRCGRQKNCRGIECLCGDATMQADCLTGATPPMGACHKEALGAAETTVILTFVERATDPASTYAVATARAVSECSTSSCAEACAPAAAP